jgi:peptide/nickel transport system permease protein
MLIRGYIVTRILATIPVMTVVAIFVFRLLQLTPGDPAAIIAGDYANPEDYIRTAYAKGVRSWSIVVRHALKNAALPVVTIIGVGFALLIGGALVTESVFALPGLGRLTADAILHRDYPVIQGIILVVSAMYVMVNLLVDLAYAFLDPRIRY